MLFERRLCDGLLDGSIRLAFRRWRRAQAVGGRTYRSPVGLVAVHDVRLVHADEISAQDARLAGYASVEELRNDLRGAPDGHMYRVELELAHTPDPRDELAHDARISEPELRWLQLKLDRLDKQRVWTHDTLAAIQASPGTRAADLATRLGWPELQEFKLHVRKLKALGLTLSLPVGYRLSPRGEAFLRAAARPHTQPPGAHPISVPGTPGAVVSQQSRAAPARLFLAHFITARRPR